MDNPFRTGHLTSKCTVTSSNVNLLLIAAANGRKAEETSQEILCRVCPTQDSEWRREAVITYVQKLIKGYLHSEVFLFGSGALKTYLPDGDIDLTVICSQNKEHALANDILAVLEREKQNNPAEFRVEDIKYINAKANAFPPSLFAHCTIRDFRGQVKLIKCIVRNIFVDISFNQLGGLRKLGFIEHMDFLIGKDHLFQRSVILIKSWCYYESRILGAYHGLISTYALEILVMYIFQLFHSSLSGPLAALHRFLDYYSNFNWNQYCISLGGPVCISSLPEIVVEKPQDTWGELLLSEEHLKNILNLFSVPKEMPETDTFSTKHLNIIDPFNKNNNLGRSVNKGNFYRIRSALSFGARKLGEILLLPEESIADALRNFFSNIWDRHSAGYMLDLQYLASGGSVVDSLRDGFNGTKDGPSLRIKDELQRRDAENAGYLSRSKIQDLRITKNNYQFGGPSLRWGGNAVPVSYDQLMKQNNNKPFLPDSSTLHGHLSKISPMVHKSTLGSSVNQKRIEMQSYHLDDENEFPPLVVPCNSSCSSASHNSILRM